MPSLAQQVHMLSALAGELDADFPHAAKAYREEAEKNPDEWAWCIAEAKRRKQEATYDTTNG